MSKVILYIAMSLDGYIATKDGGVGWLDPFNGTGDDYGFNKLVDSIDVNIQGANTYKQVLGFDVDYPYKSKSFVVTRQKLDVPSGANVEFFSGELSKLVVKAKEEAKKDIWLIGGGNLAQQFIKQNLVDEMIISLMPVLIGEGIQLFGDTGTPKSLELVEVEKFKAGVLNLRYKAVSL